MRLLALSHYDGDTDTRFGDCILLISAKSLVIYDCGHSKHAEYVETLLKTLSDISDVHIVVSHNDSDHTNGICDLLKWLKCEGKYRVTVYTHQYLRHLDTILPKIKDGKGRERVKESLLAEFDNIKAIIKEAQYQDFETVEALIGTHLGDCVIVGPTVDEFTDVAAKAVDSRQSNNIGEGHAEETVMNAASVQLRCPLDNRKSILLCGDASPDFLKDLADYSIIQLPHHGQKDDAIAIFNKLGGQAYQKEFLISDNTGSALTSGGSDELVQYMKDEHYAAAFNTKRSYVEIPSLITASQKTSQGRRYLGDLDSF